MKSAYELALERLNQASGPAKTLTSEQKERLAEIDKKYDARAASIRLHIESKLSAAASVEELDQVRAELASELQTVESQRQRDKDAVWNEA